MHARALVLAVALAVALPVVDLLFAQPPARKPRKVAFLVGVGTYDHKFSDLGAVPVNDVTAIGAALDAGGFEVVTLTGNGTGRDRATKANIETRFKEQLEGGDKLRAGDTLVVVLCGHGLQDKEPLFCPVDALPDRPADMVKLNKLIADAEPFGATCLFLVDACRDDPNRGTRSTGIQGKEARLTTKTAVLFSCGAGQFAYQHKELGHGVFTHAVLKTMKEGEGQNWDRLVAGVKEAFQSDEVKAMIPPGQTQTPVQATGELGFTPLLTAKPPSRVLPKVDVVTPPANNMAKKPDDVAKLLPNEKIEDFDYNVNDTEKKFGKRRVLTVDVGGEKMEFVRIEGGEFMMGAPAGEKDAAADEKPQRMVYLSKAFYLGKYEVTQAQYKAITGKEPSNFKGAKLPVEQVSWTNAVEFCEAATTNTKQKLSLPSEAQWEFACRAGTTTPFHFGSKLNGDHANHNGNHPYGTDANGGKHHAKTLDVGSYKANPWGLYDMSGNVWEWCADWHGIYENVAANVNPLQTIRQTFSHRSLRGGSWQDNARHCRAASRYSAEAYQGGNFIGFRVLLSAD